MEKHQGTKQIKTNEDHYFQYKSHDLPITTNENQVVGIKITTLLLKPMKHNFPFLKDFIL